MKNLKLVYVILGTILVCPIVSGDEEVDVSLSVNNLPPKIYGGNLIITSESLSVYFSVQDSNTLSDIKKIIIMFYEDNKKKISLRKYTLEGVKTKWHPKPEASFFPPFSLLREKNFQFFLKVRRVLQGIVMVNITVFDSAQNRATLFLTVQNFNS